MVERWVIIATERARRPMDFAPEVIPPNGPEGCPFCPGHEDRTPPELFRSGGSEDGPWTVRVVPNKFPALHADVEVHAAGEGIYDRMDGVGAHEVVIESPDHFAGLGTLPVAHVGEILVAYRERLLALRKDPRLEYVLIFKNHGVAAGASLEHPHSQLIATPILPELVAEELAGGGSLLPHEGALRLVRHRPPGAARREPSRPGGRRLRRRGAVRLRASPTRRGSCRPLTRPSFEGLMPDEVDALARLLRELVGRLGRLFADPPYNFALHTAPLRDTDPEHFHWHLELMPKLTRLAGFELGTGFFINPTPPEDAARFLRLAAAASDVPVG